MGARVDDDVRQVLAGSATEGMALFLPPGLDRKLYVRTAKVIEALGRVVRRRAPRRAPVLRGGTLPDVKTVLSAAAIALTVGAAGTVAYVVVTGPPPTAVHPAHHHHRTPPPHPGRRPTETHRRNG